MEISTSQMEVITTFLSFVVENGGSTEKVTIIDATDENQKTMLQKVDEKILSVCNNFVKQHKQKVKNDYACVQECGLMKQRVQKLAHSGMVHKKINESTPPLLISNQGNVATSSDVIIEVKGEDIDENFNHKNKIDNLNILHYGRNCYICKEDYKSLHHFYDQLCLACGDKNYSKRNQSIDLNGKVAIVTGARVKIGYHIALKLLRAGCHVIITTRFPNNAAARYSLESDYLQWSYRLKIYGVDFRHIRMVEAFCYHISSNYDVVDILINNACQTIRRPPAYYSHLIDKEFVAGPQWPNVCTFASALSVEDGESGGGGGGGGGDSRIGAISALASQIEMGEIQINGQHQQTFKKYKLLENNNRMFPPGQYDVDSQQIDERKKNTWRTKLDGVSSCELLEVLAINSAAPFLLIKMLKPLMKKTEPQGWSFIVNVSAMEGSFNQIKTIHHPHTNGAKAFLDMITRTSASDYAQSNIYMNSVDTGWVTNENPRPQHSSFVPPIDEIDGAARVLDPLFSCVASNSFVFGQYYKDYEVYDVGLGQRVYKANSPTRS